MYRCQQCGMQVGPCVTQMKKVVETRPVTYKHMIRAGRRVNVKTTEGWEIVKEIDVCEECAN